MPLDNFQDAYSQTDASAPAADEPDQNSQPALQFTSDQVAQMQSLAAGNKFEELGKYVAQFLNQ